VNAVISWIQGGSLKDTSYGAVLSGTELTTTASEAVVLWTA
jgi:hypothetical protein